MMGPKKEYRHTTQFWYRRAPVQATRQHRNIVATMFMMISLSVGLCLQTLFSLYDHIQMYMLRFNLMRVEIRELRPKVVTKDDEVLVHYRSRTNV